MRLAKWAQQYGGVYRVRFFYAFGVVVTDPMLVRAILQVWQHPGARKEGGDGGGFGTACGVSGGVSCGTTSITVTTT